MLSSLKYEPTKGLKQQGKCDSDYRSTSNEYISAVAGFSETTNVVMGPMEQTRRINSFVRIGSELILLRAENPFTNDHLATPVCIDVG
jgi:hypothetical protein